MRKTIEQLADEDEAIENETPQERWKRLMEYRMRRVAERLQLVGNLGGVSYSYTQEQADAVASYLQGELDMVKAELNRRFKTARQAPTL
jgi:hypothetical protein